MSSSSSDSLWPRLAGLPLVVEGYELERIATAPSAGYERATALVHLRGAGEEGLGEEINPLADEQEALLAAGASLPLAGEWTLESFVAHLATLDQWPVPPEWELARGWRNWAYESAALDLALRQAGRALHEVLGLEPRPVRFVNSLRLGDEPSSDTIHQRLARYPGVRFKLDAMPNWTPALIADLAATGAVETIDFKGRYGLPIEDPDALPAMYDRVLAAFPGVLLEDPHDLPEIAPRLAPHVDRISYDAPIRTPADLAAAPFPVRTVNVKPSRVGGLRALLELYAHCDAHGVSMYGGGMGELGVGRGQIELLASLFHADAPNDVAPSAFNEVDPPEGLPSSPLPARPERVGFRCAPRARARIGTHPRAFLHTSGLEA